MKAGPDLVLRGHWYIGSDAQRTVERTDGLHVLELVDGDSQRSPDKVLTSLSRSALFHGSVWDVPSGLPVMLAWDLTEDWRSCIRSCGDISAMGVMMTSFLSKAGKFKLQIIILSLGTGAGPCDFCSFPSWSISLWLLVKYQASRSVRCVEMYLHKLELDAPSPGLFTHSFICKETKALLLTTCNCLLQ